MLKNIRQDLKWAENGGQHPYDPHRAIRQILLIVTLSLGTFFGILFGIINMIQENYGVASIDFLVSALLSCIVYWSICKPYHTLQRVLGVCISVFFFLYLFLSGGVAYTGFLWSFIVPICALFLLGFSGGMYVSCGYLALCYMGVLGNYIFPGLIHTYDNLFLIRFLGTYIFITVVSGVYEYTRAHTLVQWGRQMTLRQAGEMALQESEKNYRSLFEDASLGIIVVQIPTFKILRANSAARNLFKHTNDKLLNLTLFDLHPPDQCKQLDEFLDTLKQGAQEPLDLLGQAADREKINLEIKISFVKHDDQACLMCFYSNISERKKAHENLVEYNKILKIAHAQAQALTAKAHAATEAKSDFLSNMSHEIRTPMNGIIGMTHILMDTQLDGEQRQYMEIIQSSSKHLLNLINDILDFSKVEAGKLKIVRTETKLTPLLREIVSLLDIKAKEKELYLNLVLDSGLPEKVWLDSVRVRQILTNLGANAIKFTQRGSVRITVRKVEKENQGQINHFLYFCVSDTGVGIPQEKVGLLFQKFSQIDASATRSFGGTGLGLAISRQLVELMGGTIGVRTELGQGSEFWFEIPLCIEENTQQNTKPHLEETVTMGSSGVAIRYRSGSQTLSTSEEKPEGLKLLQPEARDTSNGQPCILLAEDNLINQKVVVTLIKKKGMAIESVVNGKQVLEALAKQNFSLVLMDLHMPEMGGLEATTLVRKGEGAVLWSGIPIVALTADALPKEQELCLNAGMDDFLTKPINPALLYERIDYWLKAKPLP